MPGEILLACRAGVPGPQISAVRQQLGATKIKEFAQIGVQHWRLPPGLSVEQAVDALSADPNVEYAEPNYIVHINDFPDDRRLAELWGLHNVGQTDGTLDADVDAPEAWDIQIGSPDIVVGVIDTGIDYTHEDLAANIWINPNEVEDGNDTDGNGYIDDVRGWDFINDDNDPMDDNGHGTHTSGTVGAVGNNGIGVVGVNWTVTLMPLKFLSAGGSGTTADAIDAVLYAASFEDEFGNKIVRITNNSWGGGSPSNSLKQAIAGSGALFVASAGNSGRSNPKSYPAGYDLDNIISVAGVGDLMEGVNRVGPVGMNGRTEEKAIRMAQAVTVDKGVAAVGVAARSTGDRRRAQGNTIIIMDFVKRQQHQGVDARTIHQVRRIGTSELFVEHRPAPQT